MRLRLQPLLASFDMTPEELKAKADAQERDNEGKFVDEADVVATLPEGMEPVDITQPTEPEEATPPPTETVPASEVVPEEVILQRGEPFVVRDVTTSGNASTIRGRWRDRGRDGTIRVPANAPMTVQTEGAEPEAPAEPARSPAINVNREGATERDNRAIERHLSELDTIPEDWMAALDAAGGRVEVYSGPVTAHPDHADKRGVTPRGWPAGKTWDSVPGMQQGGITYLGTEGTSGTASLALHETGHAFDRALGRQSGKRWLSDDPRFVAAYDALIAAHGDRIFPYYKQAGSPGRQEAFGEAFIAAVGHPRAARIRGLGERTPEFDALVGVMQELIEEEKGGARRPPRRETATPPTPARGTRERMQAHIRDPEARRAINDENAQRMGAAVKEWRASKPWNDPEGVKAGEYAGINFQPAIATGGAALAGRYDPVDGDFVVSELGLGGSDKRLFLHEAGHALQVRVFDDTGAGEDNPMWNPLRRREPVRYRSGLGDMRPSGIQSPFYGEFADEAGSHDEPKEIAADAISIILSGDTHQYANNPRAKYVLDMAAGWMDQHGWEYPPMYEKPPLPTWNNWRTGESVGAKTWTQRPDGDEINIRRGAGGYSVVAADHHQQDESGGPAVLSWGTYRTLAQAKVAGQQALDTLRSRRPDPSAEEATPPTPEEVPAGGVQEYELTPEDLELESLWFEGSDWFDPYMVDAVDPAEYKKLVARRLEGRMRDIPTEALIATAEAYIDGYEGNDQDLLHQDALESDERTGGDEANRQWAVSRLVKAWAQSSNDEHRGSLATQEAIREQFGLEDAATWTSDVEPLALEGDVGLVVNRFVNAMYAETQDLLARHGITEVELYRGAVAEDDAHLATMLDDVEGFKALTAEKEAAGEPLTMWGTAVTRPASSWSSQQPVAQRFLRRSPDTAHAFAVMETLPASAILSTPLTGFGCADEWEFVPLGGSRRAQIAPQVGDRIDDDMFESEPVDRDAGDVHVDVDDTNADWVKQVGTWYEEENGEPYQPSDREVAPPPPQPKAPREEPTPQPPAAESRADSLQPGDVFGFEGELVRVVEARSTGGSTEVDVEFVADGYRDRIEIPSDAKVGLVGGEEATPPPPEMSPEDLIPAGELLPDDVVIYEGEPITVGTVVTDGNTVTIMGQDATGEPVEFDVPADDILQLQGEEPEPESEPEPEVLRTLTGEEARSALVRAGYNPAQAARLMQHRVYTRDGRTFAAAPTPKSKAARSLRKAEKVFDQAERRAEWYPSSPRYAQQLEEARGKLERARQKYERATLNPSRKDDEMAQDALGFLETAVGKLSPSQSTGPLGDRRAFLASIDWAGSPEVAKLRAAGAAIRGGDTMWLNPQHFSSTRPRDTGGYFMPADFASTGEYTVNHELGHLVDTPGASTARHETWQSVRSGLSGYGRTSAVEGYAEAFASWQGGNRSEVVMRFARQFGWRDVEEATPPPPPEGEEATPPPPPEEAEAIPAGELLPDDVVTYDGQPVKVTNVVTSGDTATITGETPDGETVTFDLPADEPMALGGPEPAPESDGVRILQGDEARDALAAAGHKVVGAHIGRQVYTTDGKNFVTAKLPSSALVQELDTARAAERWAQGRYDNLAGRDIPEEAEAEAELDEKRRERERIEAEMAAMPNELTPEQDAMAREALAYLDKAMASESLPASLKESGTIVGLTSLPRSDAGGYMHGDTIQVSEEDFHNPTSPDGMDTPFATQGEYAINHQLGHLYDNQSKGRLGRQRASTYEQELFLETKDQHSAKGQRSASEAHAEAFTAWMGGDRSPLIERYARTFGWDGYVEPAPEPGPAPERGEDGVYEVTGQQAYDMLVAAGFDPKQAERMSSSTLFTTDGHTFTLAPTAKTEARQAMERQEKKLREAQESAARNQSANSITVMRRAQRKYDKMKAKHDETSASAPSSREPGAARMARETLGYLDKALAGTPESLKTEADGSPRRLVASLDWSASPAQGPTVAGAAYRGGNEMWVNPKNFDRAIQEGNWHMPADTFAKYGEYVTNHELGHIIDRQDDAERRAAWEEAKRTGGLSQYGRESAAEGYAEAYAAWQNGERTPVVMIYARRFGWDEP